ncbi:MAG: FliM/FliN family flagellar motor switch protein [Planctomycetales bacterium]|nr:FliM/FliN family flagellar motor switch protein [Planctomycetales bacterium]
MSDFNAGIAPDVIAACQTNATDAADALQRGLDGKVTLEVGQAQPLGELEFKDEIAGPGLTVAFQFGESGGVLLIPETSGLLPAWYTTPDVTGEAKLGALAQELSMTVWPDSLMAERYAAHARSSLSTALDSAQPTADAVCVSLKATSEAGVVTELRLIWPLEAPQAVLAASSEDGEAADSAPPDPVVEAVASEPTPVAATSASAGVLPGFSRSLLRVEVPVCVELAQKKESIKEIVELAPGTILKFEKSCDELLRLFVGGEAIAEGEAVKIGDKFGFRVSAMLMPRERFMPLGNHSKNAAG